MKKLFFISAFAFLLAAGCTNRNLTVSEPVLSPDVDKVVASAEFVPGQTGNTKVVRIRSNRSWYAHLNDKDNPVDPTDLTQNVTWGYLSETSHINLKGDVEETELTITFKRNYSKNKVNGVLEIFSDGKLAKTLDISQDGAIYRLDATAGVEAIAENGMNVPIEIDCNTNWTLSVDPSSTVDVEFESKSGFDPSTVFVKVLENEEKIDKELVLRITATDCPDKVLVIRQNPSTSDLKTFEIFTTFISTGSGNTNRPTVVLDKANMDKDVFSSGAKFYYTTSTSGFDKIELPTTKSAELPDELSFLPATIGVSDSLFVCILGVCEGYRNTYTRVYLKNWHLTKKHVTKSTSEINFTLGFASMSSAFNYTNAKPSEIQVISKNKGTAVWGLKHHIVSAATIEFLMGDTKAGSQTFAENAVPKATPAILVSEKAKTIPGQLNRITLNASVPLWDITILEQFKYRP